MSTLQLRVNTSSGVAFSFLFLYLFCSATEDTLQSSYVFLQIKVSTELLRATFSRVGKASEDYFHILQGFCLSGSTKFIRGELDSQKVIANR